MKILRKKNAAHPAATLTVECAGLRYLISLIVSFSLRTTFSGSGA